MRKEHIIATCVASREAEETQFWESVVKSTFPESEKKLIAKLPPPEREVVYLIKFWLIDELMGVDTKHVFGLGATETVFLNERDIKAVFLNNFKGLILRLVRDNLNIKYYGIRILLLFSPKSQSKLPQEKDKADEILFDLYHLMREWCTELRSSLKVDVTFDLITKKDQILAVLDDDLRRIKHGEYLAQCGGALW